MCENLQDKLKSQAKITNVVKNSQDELKSQQMVKTPNDKLEIIDMVMTLTMS